MVKVVNYCEKFKGGLSEVVMVLSWANAKTLEPHLVLNKRCEHLRQGCVAEILIFSQLVRQVHGLTIWSASRSAGGCCEVWLRCNMSVCIFPALFGVTCHSHVIDQLNGMLPL